MYALVYGDDSCTQERKKIQKLTDCNDCSDNNLNHSHTTQPQSELSQISSELYDFIKQLWDSQSSHDTIWDLVKLFS